MYVTWRHHRQTILAGLALLALVSAMWIPFGLKLTPTGDGWIVRNTLLAGRGIIHRPGDFTRAFYFWVWPIADWLSPNSFVGHQLLLGALMLGRGLLTFQILRKLLPGASAWALAVASLSLFYPADTGFFWMGSLNTHSHAFSALLAIRLLILYWERPRVRTLALMLAGLILALWSYEAYFLILALAPLLLVWLQRGWNLRTLQTAGIWSAVVAAYAVHKSFALLSGDSPRALRILDLNPEEMMSAFALAYVRHFFDGWREALWMVTVNGQYLVLAAVIALIFLLTLRTLLGKDDARPFTAVRRLPLALVLAGLMIVGLGFLPYVPTSLRLITRRVFLLSSVGAALALVRIALWAARLIRMRKSSRWIIASIAAGLIGLSSLYGLAIHQRWADRSVRQQALLSSLIEIAPAVRQDTVFLFTISDPAEIGRIGGLTGRYSVATNAVRYLYGEQSLVAVTSAGGPEDEWEVQYADDGLRARWPQGWEEYSADRLVIFQYQPENGMQIVDAVSAWPAGSSAASNYAPFNRIDRSSGPPRRACTLFAEGFAPSGCK